MAALPAIYGYRVESELAFTRVGRGPAHRGRLVVSLGDVDAEPGPLVHSSTVNGHTFTVQRVSDARLLARCSMTGAYRLDAAVGTVAAEPADGPNRAWEHRLVSTILPIVLAERGDPVLHASALAVDDRAVLFAGPAGRGKSTLALAGVRLGHRLLAEDGAAISFDGGDLLVWPGPLGIRIRDGVVGKVISDLSVDAYADDPTPLGAVILLDQRGDGTPPRPVEPATSVPLLMPDLIYAGTDRIPETFANAARLAAAAPVYRASMPDDLERTPTALAELVAVLR